MSRLVRFVISSMVPSFSARTVLPRSTRRALGCLAINLGSSSPWYVCIISPLAPSSDGQAKPGKREQVTIAKFKEEEGVMNPGCWCKGHDLEGRRIYDAHEIDPEQNEVNILALVLLPL